MIDCYYLEEVDSFVGEFWYNNKRYISYLTAIENTALPKFQVWPLRKSRKMDFKHPPKEIFTVLASAHTFSCLLYCIESFCTLEDQQKRTGEKIQNLYLDPGSSLLTTIYTQMKV